MVKRTAHIVSVKAGAPNGFRWRWASDDGTKSGTTFAYYHECVEDARNAGYHVYLQGSPPQNPDGSARSKATGQLRATGRRKRWRDSGRRRRTSLRVDGQRTLSP